MSDNKQPFPSFEGPAEWFIAVGTFIYITGFLVALNYADYIGIREITTDLFQAKYFLIGALCLALPIAIVGMVYSIMELKIREKERSGSSTQPQKIYGSSIILIFNLILAFYMFVMFAPRDYIRHQPYLVWIIFGSTFGGLLFISRLWKNSIKTQFLS